MNENTMSDDRRALLDGTLIAGMDVLPPTELFLRRSLERNTAEDAGFMPRVMELRGPNWERVSAPGLAVLEFDEEVLDRASGEPVVATYYMVVDGTSAVELDIDLGANLRVGAPLGVVVGPEFSIEAQSSGLSPLHALNALGALENAEDVIIAMEMLDMECKDMLRDIILF